MKAGDMVSELGYYSSQPCEGHGSRAGYRKPYMSGKRLETADKTLMPLDSDGKDGFIEAHSNMNLFDEPAFTCPDADGEACCLVIG